MRANHRIKWRRDVASISPRRTPPLALWDEVILQPRGPHASMPRLCYARTFAHVYATMSVCVCKPHGSRGECGALMMHVCMYGEYIYVYECTYLHAYTHRTICHCALDGCQFLFPTCLWICVTQFASSMTTW